MRTRTTRNDRVPAPHVALRETCRKWFFSGFRASGKGLNGETVDFRKHGAVQSLLESEFERQFAEWSKK